MKKAVLTRWETGDEGTFGKLILFAEGELGQPLYGCDTLELPWRGNRRGESCVPPGKYLFKGRTDSPKHPGFVYEEWDDPTTPAREDVKDRDNIQIHAANLAGDESKGFVKQLDGCIAPGMGVTYFLAGVKPAGAKRQRGVYGSSTALTNLVEVLRKETFELTIQWTEGREPKEA